MDIPFKTQNAVRCRHCYETVTDGADCCAACGHEIFSDQPKTLIGRIKRALGIDLSDIVTISLADDGRFFTKQEIETLLRFENLVVLELDDVPHFDTMFYASKRIGRPPRRDGA
ncbi:MAG TPA: hypothetical protein VIL74_00390 [Pyrinomonadaceae bacterium]|jgi:hypothetical protein